ncbi:hypothetical protein NDU88_002501 [Pleurodeles waltl]|uniref:Uncharacterized protein n=1 Tax=Pleurodeles waltl TaxID=8319 RepID=A0AAV7VZI4_PLEWA|nr:hypothetical protein NDU88_002501 [Pleurodeles waltl]
MYGLGRWEWLGARCSVGGVGGCLTVLFPPMCTRLRYLPSSSSLLVAVLEKYSKKHWDYFKLSLHVGVSVGVFCVPPVSVSLHMGRYRQALRGGGYRPGTDGGVVFHYLVGE